MTEPDWPEILLRLGVATLVGSAIGLDRDLQGKPIGLQWKIVAVALALAFVLLTVGRRIEHYAHRALGGREEPHEDHRQT